MPMMTLPPRVTDYSATLIEHIILNTELLKMDGLHLFNDDTRPSRNSSLPTEVVVSHSCFHSLNRFIKLHHIVQVRAS